MSTMSSMSYHSTASNSGRRYSPPGVPSSCWCGTEIITYTSKTKENPFRRLYRCEIAIQVHCFTWYLQYWLNRERRIHSSKFICVAGKRRELVQMGWWSSIRWN